MHVLTVSMDTYIAESLVDGFGITLIVWLGNIHCCDVDSFL